jgi:CRP-like cAMP-binding protein
VSKTGSISFDSWYRLAFGQNTPWGDTESPAFVTQVETALERQLSLQIMRGGKRPRMKRLHPSETLIEQGTTGDTIFLLLDGVLDVEVNGERMAEIGPGAFIGERAFLEGGQRTSTLRAVTPCRVAVAFPDDLDPAVLAEVSQTHRREEWL